MQLGTNPTLGITTPQPMPNPTPGGIVWVDGNPPQELLDAGWVPWSGPDPVVAQVSVWQQAVATTTQQLRALANSPGADVFALGEAEQIMQTILASGNSAAIAQSTAMFLELSNLEAKLRTHFGDNWANGVP